MDKESLARPGRESTTELRNCACDRGRIYRSGLPTGRGELCGECEGTGKIRVFVYGKRSTAKMLIHVLVGSCAGCGASGLHEELYPVSDDDLTYFTGDELCKDCAGNHGVL